MAKTLDLITPTGKANGMVYYGNNGLNVDSFGHDSESFLAIHEKVACYGLQARQPWPGVQIPFVLYCNALLSRGADIRVLISEFNQAQRGDGSDIAHALSLTKLTYHYSAAGHRVEVYRTDHRQSRPDLVIDSIPCELKVRLDQTEARMGRHRHLLYGDRHEEYQNLYFDEIRSHDEDLRRAILVAEAGFRQGDCVFLDVASHFHTWNYHRLASGVKAGHIRELYDHPIPPEPGALILFSPDNAVSRVHRSFLPRGYWGYLRVPHQGKSL